MKEAIQKAIEGGFVLDNEIGKDTTEWGCEKEHIWIKYLKRHYDRWNNKESWTKEYKYIPYEPMFIDPLFWQALGKSLGWGNSFGFIQTSDTGEISGWLESDSAGTVYQWQYHWHRFIDHLAEGKDAESFFKELIK